MTDPHDGLTAFGPYDADQPSHPRSISLAVVGTSAATEKFRHWSGLMRGPIVLEEGLNQRLWAMYPGFEAAFDCIWPEFPTRTHEVDGVELEAASRLRDPNRRAAGVVDHYLAGLEKVYKADERVDVAVCIVPDFVYSRCRPQSRVASPIGYNPSATVRRQREAGQPDLFDPFDPALYEYSVDFRRQLKARSMEYGIPIQLIRESTLRIGPPERFGERTLTPLSDRAWNIAVAAYYKAGGKPWRLTSAREGVCYIGLTYKRRDPSSESRSACCAAQMFLDSGDGIVFMGEFGPWYSPERNQYHLSRQSASQLLDGVLKTYQQLEGKPLTEVFLHSRSTINREEFGGFLEACPADVKLVGIRVRLERRGYRVFREGNMPVVRGSLDQIDDKAAFIWGSGFKPLLGTYDGWEVPAPLRVDLQHGKADVLQVCSDILGLTKLNYNACRLGESEPVTVGFSDAVGEILVSNPTISRRLPQFRFYI